MADRLGSVIALSDASGVVQSEITYDAFGRILSESNAGFGDRYKYASQQFDSASGLQGTPNRWYDPATGRWLSRDPIGFAAGDANLYRYVGNDSTNWIDPGGVDRFEAWLARRFYWSASDKKTELDIAIQANQEALRAQADPNRDSTYTQPDGIPEIVDLNRMSRRGPTSAGQIGTWEGQSYATMGPIAVWMITELVKKVGRDLLVEYGGGSAVRFATYLTKNGFRLTKNSIFKNGKKLCGSELDDALKAAAKEYKAASSVSAVVRNPRWRQSVANSDILKRRLGIRPGSGNDAHHIVLGGHRRAAPSQAILDHYQIDINAAENGVALVGGRGAPKTVSPRHHRGSDLHSRAGIDAVNDRLKAATNGVTDWAKGRQRVLDTLADIAAEIQVGAFP